MRVTEGGSNGSVHNKECGEVKPNDWKEVKTKSMKGTDSILGHPLFVEYLQMLLMSLQHGILRKVWLVS